MRVKREKRALYCALCVHYILVEEEDDDDNDCIVPLYLFKMCGWYMVAVFGGLKPMRLRKLIQHERATGQQLFVLIFEHYCHFLLSTALFLHCGLMIAI